MSRSALASVAAASLLLLALAGCGGGGGGGGGYSGGGGSSSSSSSSAGVDSGTLKTMDDSVAFTVKNASSGQFLAISGHSQTAGAAIVTVASASSADQNWHVMPMTGSQYNIENMLTHQVAGISAASTAAGAGSVQYADNGTNDHLWNFYLLTDGNYLIKNVNSTLYLTADSSGNVTQAARTSSGTTQEWTITTGAAAYPAPRTVSGAGVAVHDPNLIVDPTGKFWLYGTHNTLASSSDLTTFTNVTGGIFATDFAWWAAKNTTGGSGRTDLWAPSVLYANSKYYQYYSIPIYDIPGTAGTNNGAEAVIGLATSPNPDGPWTDQGQIIASCGHTTGCATGFNAIDPAPYIDASGKWWLSFGSWEDGIHVLALDPATGLRLASDMTLRDIAKRAAGEEGSFIFPWTVGGTTWYYYFASINVCCSATSPYRIVVGRSASPTGPFLDRGGLDLHDGGGTILLSAHGHVQGPGGQSVVAISGTPTLVYHFYDSNLSGAPRLGINSLSFDADGWPVVN